MVPRMVCAFAMLLLLTLPAVQKAIALGISQRFSYLLLFNLAW